MHILGLITFMMKPSGKPFNVGMLRDYVLMNISNVFIST